MEPERHRLDRAARLKEHDETAARIRYEVDQVVEAADEKRDAFVEGVVERLRNEARDDAERERIWADRRVVYGHGRTSTAGHTAQPKAPQPVSCDELEAHATATALAATG